MESPHIPRITKADVDAAIVAQYTFNTSKAIATLGLPANEALDVLTLCVLVLENGFTVIGESACVSSELFDASIGERLAIENARLKLWRLMGYALKDRLYRGSSQGVPVPF